MLSLSILFIFLRKNVKVATYTLVTLEKHADVITLTVGIISDISPVESVSTSKDVLAAVASLPLDLCT